MASGSGSSAVAVAQERDPTGLGKGWRRRAGVLASSTAGILPVIAGRDAPDTAATMAAVRTVAAELP